MPANQTPRRDTAVLLESPKQADKSLHGWRVRSFEDLKFTRREAELLATATESHVIRGKNGEKRFYRSPLSYSTVKRMLEQGCNHKLLVEIFR